MKIKVQNTQIHALNMKARMPFRYGIASLEALPHLFVQVEITIDGKPFHGIASDGLPPKWFTKDPEAAFEKELQDMIDVIRHACEISCELNSANNLFELWVQLMDAQESWADEKGFPPLLGFFGVSLIERAIMDAICRAQSLSFHQVLRSNGFGIRPGAFHRELKDLDFQRVFPETPTQSMAIRHTVGLTDPLFDSDISLDDRLHDSLPQSLTASIQAYGLKYFKIKIRGQLDADLDRLIRLSEALSRCCGSDFHFTLDGNEQYQNIQSFREHWDVFQNETRLKDFWTSLLFVEQPLHRDHALNLSVQKELSQWQERPMMIIDESDAEISSLPEALKYGYSGVSHKNCKSVIKGALNACLIAHRCHEFPEKKWLLSSEDLANVGPVALTQDFAVAAALGIQHSERNGHHYFAGLSMYPASIQKAVLDEHPDLYHKSESGFPTLNCQDGHVNLTTVNQAPFGYGLDLNTAHFTPIQEWDPATLKEF